jgi:hypothetical protein
MLPRSMRTEEDAAVVAGAGSAMVVVVVWGCAGAVVWSGRRGKCFKSGVYQSIGPSIDRPTIHQRLGRSVDQSIPTVVCSL